MTKVLLLSPYPEQLEDAWKPHDAVRTLFGDPEEEDYRWADIVVSYGYRKILSRAALAIVPIINVHIGFLPWNRGADPNFWSWFDDTPKGVTIHEMDSGIDTGPILLRTRAVLNDKGTLRSTYAQLQTLAANSFAYFWKFREGTPAVPQQGPGSYHKHADAEPYLAKLSNGWDTPVAEVMEMGRATREAAVA